ncbi:MAG: hypothetical protein ACI9FJ_000951, partial [Alteromonadaceae bacterium]
RNKASTLVWETYMHRSGVYPANAKLSNRGGGAKTGLYGVPPQPWDSRPEYVFNHPVNSNGVNFHLLNNLDETHFMGRYQLFSPQANGPAQQWLFETKVNKVKWQYVNDNYEDVVSHGRYNRLQFPANSLQVKAVWRPLDSIPAEQQYRYHTADAIYYTNQNDGVKANNGQFALVALHIAHKTVHYPSYIFASFEHQDNLLDPLTQQPSGLYYTQTGSANPVPVADYNDPTSQVNNVNQQALKAMQAIPGFNQHFIWQYYRLKGVQGIPTDDTTSPDYELNKFVQQSYQPDDNNKLIDGVTPEKPVVMGGCQGCHSVAQQQGFDFSFTHIGSGGRGFSAMPSGLKAGQLVTKPTALPATKPVVTKPPLNKPKVTVKPKPLVTTALETTTVSVLPTSDKSIGWKVIADSAQYGANWQGKVSHWKNMTLTQAKIYAAKNPNINFFFLVTDKAFHLTDHGRFEIGEVVFFSGKPVPGGVKGTHIYVKK